MKIWNHYLSALLLLTSSPIILADEADIGVAVSAEMMHFFHERDSDSDIEGDGLQAISFTIQPSYRQSWDFDKKVIDIELFHRQDIRDEQRTYSDIRELSWTHAINDMEYKIGISKEFWGVAESYPLVDVINQIDYSEALDYKSRLGQPMIKIAYFSDWGNVSAWVLPFFRERNFTSNQSRAFSGEIDVESDNAQYYSKKGKKHVDYALRYANTLGDIDFGIGYFQGTSRNPVLNYNAQSNRLTPFYDNLKQLSTDMQWTGDALLLKLEALHRDEATFGSSQAAIVGFEYTLFNLYNGHDLGFISEYLYDSLGKTRSSFDNDVFYGLRYTLNNINATEIIAGGYVDIDNGTSLFRLTVQHRIATNWKYEFIIHTFNHVDDNDLFFAGVENDDYARLNLRYYF